jgi:hypothetical protein
MKKTTFSPQGGSDTGVYTSELGPGGNSIVNRFHSHGAVGDFEGLLVMTWDAKENAYKSYVFGNEFRGCIVQTGQFEGDVLRFSSEFSAEGMKLKLRIVTRVSGPGKIASEEYITAEGFSGNLACAGGSQKTTITEKRQERASGDEESCCAGGKPDD